MRWLGLAAVGVLLLASCGGGRPAVAPPAKTLVHRHRTAPAPPVTLAARTTGILPAPLQDAAAAPWPGGGVFVGGLTAADTSSDQILVATRAGARIVGRLPGAFHDSAAAHLGGAVYAFGGGNGVAQLDQILRIDPHTGRTAIVGRLPAPSSDQSAASIGRTAYVVGGYTGTRWLDTIVAWRPGSTAHVVARLPYVVRYAAVATADGKLVIAGGSLENGTASSPCTSSCRIVTCD
ncbi:MAG: kelch repeat-containing protein [Actinomycetota bacterium]